MIALRVRVGVRVGVRFSRGARAGRGKAGVQVWSSCDQHGDQSPAPASACSSMSSLSPIAANGTRRWPRPPLQVHAAALWVQNAAGGKDRPAEAQHRPRALCTLLNWRAGSNRSVAVPNPPRPICFCQHQVTASLRLNTKSHRPAVTHQTEELRVPGSIPGKGTGWRPSQQAGTAPCTRLAPTAQYPLAPPSVA